MTATAAEAPGGLALALEEVFTAVVRLQQHRQSIADAATFRAHLRQLLADAEPACLQAGYAREDVDAARYAVVVFADEVVLNSGLPAFADWPRRPLQEELFGGHVGGDEFYTRLHGYLTARDTPATADVLEVFLLCLDLGFRGRHRTAREGQLEQLVQSITERIQRLRGEGPLAPHGALPRGERVAVSRDRWVPRLALACLVVAIAVGVVYGLGKAAVAREAGVFRTAVAPGGGA